MSIKTDQLQQNAAPQLTDTLLLADSAGGTAQLSLAQAAAFFGTEMVKAGNPVGAALSSKAALSAQEAVELTAVESVSVTLDAAELQAYLDALPRFLTEELVLSVSGELDTEAHVKDFCGPGSIHIYGNGFEMQNVMSISNCSVAVSINCMDFAAKGGVTDNKYLLDVENCRFVKATLCGFAGQGKGETCGGSRSAFGSNIIFAGCQFSGLASAVLAAYGSIAAVSGAEPSYENNARGAYVWHGGIIMLGPGIPDTLGGVSNANQGGLIVKSDGTLL